MARAIPFVLALLLGCARAWAGDSLVLPDGLNRAPAVTLHCTSNGTNAAPCGVASQPLVVAPVAGGATAGN
jgi:hypothetical protein